MVRNFLDIVRARARVRPARIVFPESSDPRVLRAVAKIIEDRIACPVLIGDPKKIASDAAKLHLSLDPSEYAVINMETSKALKEHYTKKLFEFRQEKGMTLEEAERLVNDINYFGVMMVKLGEADGMISGSSSSTPDVLRPALQIIRTKEKFHKVSGFFFMVLENRLLLFADCAVNIEPNSYELAEIAIDTAETAKRFGLTPRIAMLSFSTNGSTRHPNSDRVHEATQIVRDRRPDLICEGEMQVDAALVPAVCARKFPKSLVPGNANILIFPNLESANISYKLVERLGHAEAIGPIIQGLQKPINDLSRGCSVEDIFQLAAITSVEAQDARMRVGKVCLIK